MNEPRVKEILKAYSKGNLRSVIEYLSCDDILIDTNTWTGQLKKMIDEEQFLTAKMMIETLAYKFNTNIKK